MAKIIVIAGPTAVGKSALSLALARRLDGEIISADSMQIYRGMDIGTAKATPAERAEIVHHLLDIRDPFEEYSCADYASDARRCVNDILSRGKTPIFCGGTGLYLKQALCDASVASPPGDPALRALLEARDPAENYRELSACDPESAAAIHPNNHRRVIRALEIFRLSGIPKSVWDRETPSEQYRSDALLLCLTAPREQLYARIDRRVEEMVEAGLPGEVRALDLDPTTTAGQAIGYKEMLGYIRGEQTLTEAVGMIQMASRRYAKRQLTWFRHQNGFTMLDVSAFANFEDIVNFVADTFEKSKNVL
ncbi:MAG: tRNA (adenosine(37)-N6)-dimethylallyltransferase MiaA [Clostridia bacterium]|nr:tRNA (adenosine(37)-N6)-dimethylallyltransferase MiaA [Clostridia bacterium]MBQ8382926.1 tRNA (adenosine(37)-N6)-dimethylallyltransferase MiaA [Clostridia bacterium]